MPVPIEISISANREDIQKTAYFLARRTHSWWHLQAVLWSAAAFLAFFAEQWIPMGICAVIAAGNWLKPWLQLKWQERKQPEWAYAPMIYNLDDGGVFVMAPQASRQLSWDAISKVTLTDDAWIFKAPGQEPIILHRRTLSKEDNAAIRAMAEYYEGQTARPPSQRHGPEGWNGPSGRHELVGRHEPPGRHGR
jgi:hypothetical protein